MITPADIQTKEFTKSIRGYEQEEVDMFLDLITLDFEKLIKENLNLKAQIATLEKASVNIPGSDLSVKDTLETAKKLMDDLARSSEKRASSLVENAEMDAAIIIKDARMKAEQVAIDCQELVRKYQHFQKEYRELLTRHLDDFNDTEKAIDIDRLASILEDRKINNFDAKEDELSKVAASSENQNKDDKKTIVNIKY